MRSYVLTRVRGSSEDRHSDRSEGGSGRARGSGRQKGTRGRGEADRGKGENCAWIVFPLPRPEENLRPYIKPSSVFSSAPRSPLLTLASANSLTYAGTYE